VAVSLADTSIVVWETAPWVAAADAAVARVVPADLGPLWDKLAGDAVTSLRAARLLAAAGDRGVAFLKGKVSVIQPPSADRVKGLIADLDSSRFAAREQAEADLREFGSLAEVHLRAARKAGPSAEASKRIDNLLAAIAAYKLTSGQLRELRGVQALRWQDSPASRALLGEWAKGDPAATLTRAVMGK
jgi:hypothetical protein